VQARDRTDLAPADLAADLQSAGFVRLVAPADGDGVAAAGVLARALARVDTPYQVSTAATAGACDDRLARAAELADEADLTVALGPADGPATVLDPVEEPLSVAAFRTATAVADDADPTGVAALAAAGALAGGASLGADALAPVVTALEAADAFERRPGVAVPGVDLADGLAHSTLVHGPFSGDLDRTADALAGVLDEDPTAVSVDDLDEASARAVASTVALRVAGDEAATPYAGTAVERGLRPHVGGPLGTLGGLADVLTASAREAPGAATALAAGHAADPAVAAWRRHADRAHDAVRSAHTGRYDGLLAARVDDAPAPTVARLLARYRSPEPVVLVVGDEEAAAVAREGTVATATRAAADAVEARADVRERRGYVRLDEDADATALIAAFREASP
jgi:hypothetical protein